MTLHERFSCCVFFVAKKQLIGLLRCNEKRNKSRKTAYYPVRLYMLTEDNRDAIYDEIRTIIFADRKEAKELEPL
jgi:hypothetical protein